MARCLVLIMDGFPDDEVVALRDALRYEVLAQEGLLASYESPILEEYDGDWSSPENMWHGYYIGPLAIGINSDRWESEFGEDTPRPETWDDLLDDRFDNEIVIASPVTSGTAYNFLATQIFRLGEEDAWTYLTDFDDRVAFYTTSGGAPAQLVGTGEYLMGITFVQDMLAVADAGFPVETVLPDQTGFEVGSVGIIEGGPNPDAAQAFVDFILSAPAGQIQTDLSKGLSLHPEVRQPAEAPDMSTVQTVDFDVVQAAQNRDRWLDEWEAHIGADAQ
jgi:iron(III) transport system substrate-binding protein